MLIGSTNRLKTTTKATDTLKPPITSLNSGAHSLSSHYLAQNKNKMIDSSGIQSDKRTSPTTSLQSITPLSSIIDKNCNLLANSTRHTIRYASIIILKKVPLLMPIPLEGAIVAS
jgi:hypothetical protein